MVNPGDGLVLQEGNAACIIKRSKKVKCGLDTFIYANREA